MNIIVCIKQVPNTNEVKINQETGTLIRDGVPSIINPDDKNAIEAALQLREINGGKVTVISMGPPQAKEALKEAYAMGADEVYLVSDKAFGGSDTWATATVLAAVIKKIGNYDIIFCGRQAIDGDTAQVGPEIAEFLDIPQVTYAKYIEDKGKNFVITRKTEGADYIIETSKPVLITAIQDLNKPRYPQVKRIFEVYASNDIVKTWTSEDIPVDLTQIGLKGSPTNVYSSFVPTKEKHSEIIDGTDKNEKAEKLLDKLKAAGVI
ncbi:MAG: electron transfer flavoprotein subunit beta/FixA family protein [Fusobacteriaceae bacterium]|jgi:electron transfer flavoprotein beta subunit|nr:electron transfer flavoprotein subunit beta/FixA family protein [Fusobacteriaceae bacterium]